MNVERAFMEEIDKIDVRIVQAADPEAVVRLYKAGGWWDENSSQDEILPLILGSFAFAIATDTGTGEIIGMGRALSDGVCDAYIQDVIVLPGYRKCGIGREIIRTLVGFCLERKVSWVALIAEPGSEEFYRGLGFSRMKGHVPMRHLREEK